MRFDPNGSTRFYQLRWPADAQQHAVRRADSDFIETPLPVSQNTTGTDNKLVRPRSNLIDMRSSNENTERVMHLINAPRRLSGLRQMQLAVPTSDKLLLSVISGAGEAELFPKC